MSKTTKLFAGFVVASVALSLVVVGTASAAGYTFTSTLKVGSRGAEVAELQKVLNADTATQVAATGPGSVGNETTTFGGLTKAAVIKFQNKYASEVLTPVGLKTGTGLVGAMTRAKLNAISAGTATGGTTGGTTGGSTVIPAGTGLTITDPGQPGVSLAPALASRVPFTKIKVSAGNDGDVTVNSVTVERTGLAVDSNFSGVVLLDENGIQIGDSKTFNSNHQAIIGTPFVVKSGTSKVLTIAGNMASAATVQAGQVASLTVVSVNTNGAVVSGALPITGAAHTINATLALGSVTTAISSYDPSTTATKEIGTTNYKFSGLRITAGSAEKLRLWSVRWYQSGSAGASDLANVMTYVDGVAYPVTVSSDGKYYSTVFPGGILIDKGLAKDVWIAGDIIGSSSANRTVQFDIYKTTDVYLTGETYGYGVQPAVGSGSTHTTRTTTTITTGTPWFESSPVTISAGSATSITKASAVSAQNIALNVPNQVLGGFQTDIKGEPISVQSLVFTVSTSTVSGSYGYLTNVTIVDQNGAVVAGPVDASGAGTSLTFTDTITFPVGQRVYTIKGKVASTVANGTVYTLSTTPSSQWTNVTGLITGNTISLSSNGAFSMNAMTVKSGSLAVTVSGTPAVQTIVAGGTQRSFATYQLDATQSGEDLRLTSLPLTVTYGGRAALSDLSSCQLYDGGNALNTGTNVINTTSQSATTSAQASTFTFDSALVVPKGAVKSLTLKCNVSSSALSTSSYSWGITSTQIGALNLTGTFSNQSVVATGSTAAGNAQSIGAGSIAASTDASSPGYAVAAANATGVTVGVLKFRSTNETVNLTKVGLTLTNTASSSASDLVQVTLWNGSTQVGTATFTGSNTSATSTLTIPLVATKDQDVNLTVKADLAAIGASQAVTVSGHLLAVDYLNGEGVGAESGTTIYTTGSSSVAGVRIFKSYPTFALDTLSSSGVADGRLMRFKVTANTAGNVGIAKFVVTLSTTSASVTGVNIFGYTDSSYSQPISGVNTGGQFMTSNVTPTATTPTMSIYPQTTGAATTTVQVPAGATYYFEVKGTVAGSGTSYSVTTTLNGDSSYPSLSASTASVATVDAGSVRSFIWSPNSTTTAAVANNDWTNGYGLMGLPASGLIQTRTN
jgi:hypothetical protein